MLFSERPLAGMGAPPLPSLQPEARHFPQWSRTAILTLAALSEDDVVGEVKKSPPEPTSGGFIIGGDPAARVAHLEHSVRFLQEQHRQMLSGLHAEIEALRERNRDLQFQLIFNKESPPKANSPVEEPAESNETKLKREVTRLEREASVARGETKTAEARADQLQRLVDAQTEKLRELEVKASSCSCGAAGPAAESRGELRARLGEAERLVRRLRADAERQRRELQCMKNSLHASLRASGLDAYGYQNNYHFPPVHTPDFWREPLREEFTMVGSRGRSSRRPLTLPELAGQQVHRSTVYANPYAIPDHTRPRANGHEKNKKGQATNGDANTNPKTPDEATASTGEARGRARRTHTRKHADHT
ncbi:unnamed protein product [Chrysodeixis includens]|uniref:CCDC92/74 N-terminal domain-containing protein n=1 Tax=Chrysodeixis includens TaxID=689277 RepID=A0A9P0BR89_CHRIL|nr:unnamed protein product [Chrysodeixis includens]